MRTKKRPLSSMKKECDILFSLLVRERDGHKCVLCQSTSMPQCGHVLSRVALATRWDESNAFCQCAKCNMKHEWNAYPFISWFISKFGKEKLDELQARWNKPHPMNRGEYEELIATLKKRLEEVKNERRNLLA